MKNEPVTAEELDGVKARAKCQFLDSHRQQHGPRHELAIAQNLQGDWREMFRVSTRSTRSPPPTSSASPRRPSSSQPHRGLIETTAGQADERAHREDAIR